MADRSGTGTLSPSNTQSGNEHPGLSPNRLKTPPDGEGQAGGGEEMRSPHPPAPGHARGHCARTPSPLVLCNMIIDGTGTGD